MKNEIHSRINHSGPISSTSSDVKHSNAGLNHNSQITLSEGTSFYDTLANHQLEQKDWRHHPTLVELHRWKDLFIAEFDLSLPSIAVCVGPTRVNCYGYYRPGHNAFGFRREILIKEAHLLQHIRAGECWRVLGTLLHELLHAWQDLNGKPGKNNYHNIEFREKAAKFGLIVDTRGYTQYAPESSFMSLLQKHGIQIPKLPTPTLKPIGKSKLRKWSCGCTNVRVAISDFRAKCLNCGNEFQPAD